MKKQTKHWFLWGLSGCAFAGFLVLFLVHLNDQVNWRYYYQNVYKFGNECQAAIHEWPGSFEAARQLDLRYRPLTMPYRAEPNAPTMELGSFIATKCQLDLSLFKRDPYLILDLGPVFGASEVYLNGNLKAKSNHSRSIQITLTPKDSPGDKAELEVISYRSEGDQAGMASLIPPFMTANESNIQVINRYLSAIYLEQTNFRLALATMIAFLYLFLWQFGLRYRDIFWMTALASLISLVNLDVYISYFASEQTYLMRAEGALNFAIVIATWLFYWSVFRAKKISNRISWLLLVSFLSAFIVCFFIPTDLFFSWRLLGQFQSYLLSMGLLLVLALNFKPIFFNHSLPKRARIRNRLFLGLALFTAGIYALQAYLEDYHGIYIAPVVQIGLLFVYALFSLIDIADRQRSFLVEREKNLILEKEIDEAKALAKAAQMLAHDIRRPFNLLRVFSDSVLNLKNDTDVAAFKKELLPDIVHSHQVVEGLLKDLSQLDSKINLDSQPTCLDEVICDALSTLSKTHKQREVLVSYDLKETHLHCDYSKAKRILGNIIENALHAVNEGGRITMLSRLDDHQGVMVNIGVHNTGSYISGDLQEKIFGWSFSTRNDGGSGLGLAIAKSFVLAHGGEMWIDSSELNGTTFWLQLPKSNTPAPKKEIVLPDRLGLGRHIGYDSTRLLPAELPCVALVDDDELQILAWKLVVKDAAIESFLSPAELLEKCSQIPDYVERFSVFVVDMYFANKAFDGIALAAKIRNLRPDAYIVLSSNQRLPNITELPFDLVIDKQPQSLANLLRKRS